MAEIIPSGFPMGISAGGLLLAKAAAMLLMALLVTAAVWSLQVAHADLLYRQGTPESIARATELVPGDAKYLANRSSWVRRPGPRTWRRLLPSTRFLRRMDRSLAWRPGPRRPANRRLFLEAARIDNTFSPRWSQPFYFRRGVRTSSGSGRGSLEMTPETLPRCSGSAGCSDRSRAHPPGSRYRRPQPPGSLFALPGQGRLRAAAPWPAA
jgi:hypothetical protein